MAASSDPSRECPFRLSVFRGPSLAKGEEVAALSHQVRLLLGIVGAHGPKGITRAELGEFLWKSGTREAQGSRLAQLLLTVRTKVDDPEIVIAFGSRLALNRRLVRTDLEDFRDALQTSAFDEALEILEGGFFVDAVGELTQRASEWIGERQIHYRSEVRNALAEACQLSEGISDFAGIVRISELQIRLDPDDERHLRRLLKALAMQGKVEKARAAFRSHEERMRLTDPEWEPEPETERVRGELGRLSERSRNAVIRGSLRGRIDRPEVPRAELGTVIEALALSDTGRPACIAVSGARGVGKTSFAAQVASLHAARGWAVFGIRCSRTLERHPFAAITQVDPNRLVGPALGSVARATLALSRVLRAAGSGHRSLLVVDDVASCDSFSRAALELLVTADRTRSVTLLLAGTSAEISRERRRWADRLGPVLAVTLRGLSEESVVPYLRAQKVSQRSIDGCVQRLMRTGGNPGLMGLDLRRAEEGPLDPNAMDEAAFEAISAWLAEGSIHARACLLALCCGPESWRTDDLAAALRIDVGRCDEAVAFLVDAGLALHDADGLRVAAPIIRDFGRQLSEHGVPELRRALAGQMTEMGLPAEQLADAWGLAGDRKNTIRFARAAAVTAYRQGSIRPRVSLLRLAHKAAGDGEEAKEILVELAQALLAARELQEALPLITQVSADALTRGDYGAWLHSQVLREDAAGHLEGGRPSEVANRLLALVDVCIEHGQVRPAATSVSLALHHFHREGDEQGVRRVFARALDLLRGPLPGDAEARLLMTLAVQTYYGEPAKGVRNARLAVEKAAESGDPTIHLAALNRLLTVLIATGRLASDEGAGVTQQALTLASKVGDLLERTHPLINLAVWDADCGDYEGSTARLIRALPSVERAQDRRPLLIMLCNLGVAQLRGGRFGAAEQTLQQAYELLESWSFEEVRVQVVAGLGWVSLERGSMRDAQRFFEELSSRPVCRSADVTTATLFSARLLRRSGQIALAATIYEEALERTRGRFPLHHIALVAERTRALPAGVQLQNWTDEVAVARSAAEELGVPRWMARLSAISGLR